MSRSHAPFRFASYIPKQPTRNRNLAVLVRSIGIQHRKVSLAFLPSSVDGTPNGYTVRDTINRGDRRHRRSTRWPGHVLSIRKFTLKPGLTKIPVNNALGVSLMIRSALLGAMATRIPMLIPADARFPKPQTALHEGLAQSRTGKRIPTIGR